MKCVTKVTINVDIEWSFKQAVTNFQTLILTLFFRNWPAQLQSEWSGHLFFQVRLLAISAEQLNLLANTFEDRKVILNL